MKKIVSIVILSLFLINMISSIIPSLYGKEIEDCSCGYYLEDDEKIYSYDIEHRVMSMPIDCTKLSISKPNQLIIDTPNEFSWTNVDGNDWTTIAKHQGNCGSCWDFAALGALESRIMIEEQCSDLKPDLSEQYALSCLPDSANNYGRGCYGGTPFKAYFYIMNETEEGNYYNGIIPESCFPYRASHDTPCEDKCQDWIDHLIPINYCEEFFLEFDYDTPENRAILKSIIYEDGPIAVALNVTQDFTDYWGLHHNPNDYYPDTDEPWGNSLNHIVVIVGWKDDPSIENGGYWIVKNSWGTNWGYDGFFNLEYGGLFIAMYYATANYDAESIDWPPIANAGGLYQVEPDDIITFDGSSSIDAEGEILSYKWDFGDYKTGDEATTTHSYKDEGIYVVTLTVTDSEGNIGVDSTLVGVGQEPINIDASGLFGIEVTIENPSNELVLTNLEWNADISELILYGNSHGIIPKLSKDEAFSKQIYVAGVGIGSISINVENIEKTEKFIVIGPLVLGLDLQ